MAAPFTASTSSAPAMTVTEASPFGSSSLLSQEFVTMPVMQAMHDRHKSVNVCLKAIINSFRDPASLGIQGMLHEARSDTRMMWLRCLNAAGDIFRRISIRDPGL